MDCAVLRTREEFQSLREDWERLSAEADEPEFYLSFDWFHAVLHLAQDAPEQPYLVTVRSDGGLVAVLPGCLATRRLRLFSYRSLELIGNIYSPLRGCPVKPGHEDAVADALTEFLLDKGRDDWELLHFEAVSEHDAFMTRLLDRLRASGARARRVPQFENVVTDRPDSGGSVAYFQGLSKSLRQSVRSGINRMNREGDFDVVLVTKTGPDMENAMMDYYDIYGESWKREEGDPEFHRKLARHLAAKDRLRLFMLYYRERGEGEEEAEHPITSWEHMVEPDRLIPEGYFPVAACLFVVYGRQAYFLKTAYREDYRRFSPGSVLFWLAARNLFDAGQALVIDHQKGDESYKLRWGEVHESRLAYQVAHPGSLRARLELWNEDRVIPKLRTAKRWVRRTGTNTDERKER
jgi:CelD/BcsL family acetyltransferase involved in cellulose biosynthesis